MQKLLVNLAVAGVLLCLPIFLGGFAWSAYLITEHAPIWVFLVYCVSVVAVCLGIAMILDTKNPLPPRQ